MSSFVTTEKLSLVAVARVCLVTLAPRYACRVGGHLITGRAVGSGGTSWEGQAVHPNGQVLGQHPSAAPSVESDAWDSGKGKCPGEQAVTVAPGRGLAGHL